MANEVKNDENITDTAGTTIGNRSSDNFNVIPNEMKINLFNFKLCTIDPFTPGGNPDFDGSEVLFSGTKEVTIQKNLENELDIEDLLLRQGTYPWAVMIIENYIKVKHNYVTTKTRLFNNKTTNDNNGLDNSSVETLGQVTEAITHPPEFDTTYTPTYAGNIQIYSRRNKTQRNRIT